jgi:hypothetical protein
MIPQQDLDSLVRDNLLWMFSIGHLQDLKCGDMLEMGIIKFQ